MNSLVMFAVSFGLILSGTFAGFYVARRLPEHHLDKATEDTFKTAWGIVATMSALVLGLLLSSAKGSYDFVKGEITQSAAKVILLDQYLDSYGPETKYARKELRERVAIRIPQIWPDDGAVVPASAALEAGRGMRAVLDRLNELTPTTDAQRMLQTQAQQITGDLMLTRWLVIEQSKDSLPITFFLVLVSWLTMLFFGIGLFAPFHRTVLLTLVLCNLTVSSAIFLINELDRPLDGFIQIPSAPMREALENLSHR